MTTEIKTHTLTLDSQYPEDFDVIKTIAVGVAASGEIGTLHDLAETRNDEEYDPWDEERPFQVEAIDGTKEDVLARGLHIIFGNTANIENPVLTIRDEELPAMIEALEDAEDLIGGGRLVFDLDKVREAELKLHSVEDEFLKAA